MFRKLLVVAVIAASALVVAQETKAPNDVPNIRGVVPPATGGPDAFGYVFADSTTDQCAFQYIDITATGASVLTGDDAGVPVNLPGPALDFYGETVTDIGFTSNGFLSTDSADGGGDLSNDCPLPAAPSTGTGGRYYVVHDDLITGDGLFEYFPACPRPSGAVANEGCYVFQWNGVTHFGGADPFGFQAVLYDTSFAIAYQYLPGNTEAGSGSTTGIQNLAATDSLTYACDAPTPITAGDGAACFYHPNFPFGLGPDIPEPAAPVPAMGSVGMIALALLMLGLAVVMLRRRA